MGNWQLQLKSTYEMLPYFAASGHNLYTKSAYIYLQIMCKIEETHPEVYEAFMRGHHVSKRSDCFWAGLSTDLVIEQVVMRSVKTTGDLTRKRGMGETQRSYWLLSMPACAEMNVALQDLTEINYETSEQHEKMSTARLKRAEKDSKTVLVYLQDRNPFTDDISLWDISTGVVTQTSANAECAEVVGKALLTSMENESSIEHTFKKKDRITPIETSSIVTIDRENVPVDPQLLFQRLVTAAGDFYDNPQEIFRYELCSFPSALFESSSLMRAANKATLTDAIWALGECQASDRMLNETQIYVIDGGSLLQHLSWPRRVSFSGIYKLYTNFFTKKYANSVTVFDGYEIGPSTKDNTHLSRSKEKVGSEVHVKEDMILQSKKEFLAKVVNKQQFIYLLSEKLRQVGCNTVHATGDADLLTVQIAVEYAENSSTTVIGEDIDLLVLLCTHADMNKSDIIFRSEAKQKTKKCGVWDIKKPKEALRQDKCFLLPIIHTVSGYDTTSRVYGNAKSVSLKKVKSPFFVREASVFLNSKSTPDEIVNAGGKLLVALFGGKECDELNTLRFRRFCEKLSSNAASNEDFSFQHLKEGIHIYGKLIAGEVTPENVYEIDVIDSIARRLNDVSKSMKSSRASTLWLQCMKMLDILRQFIKAERMGNWQLQLKSTYQMLQYFAASGHNLYTKSAYIYLQIMCKIEEPHPEVYEAFMRGHHVSRRSDCFWAGLSTDLVIEQVVMRSVKTTGGLTRGRGMGETQRASWLLSMPACAEMNVAMQDLTEINYETSEQHEEMSTARLKRDEKDSKTVLVYLQNRNPFTDDISLQNISTGVVTQTSANAECAEVVGKAILTSVENESSIEYTFKKKDRITPIETSSVVTIDGENVPVDPQLLFQRLVTAARDFYDNPQEIF